MNLARAIKSIIINRRELTDKNGIITSLWELENGESILVFADKVNPKKWNWLKEGQEIKFTVEEGRQEANLLIDFVIET